MRFYLFIIYLLILLCISEYSIHPYFGFIIYTVLTLLSVSGILKTLLIFKVMPTKTLTDPKHFGKEKYLLKQPRFNNTNEKAASFYISYLQVL